ncbi:hypothetical protein FVEG_15188 [Fusarium verticillioides 7600]|uniref:Secreted protein n=1 Tax=Gibberella moniliformis (strain M3125 / FGSC 7600) TaxID=334819 RepID=W7LQT9_GIBM7|nr:hypothetical protein FVEG_15188 [Fusarium verticillioides 7600]XP_018747061.1 hypothetical protein FVEG_15188 [Fusarium verticillioides 7600]XP_018747062.1 hypothetical protein FVEG_15188 [Fusarium verticillioides 7600]EWG40869.1 hypothetical protein FVEG_15188 [Fusarium verticillioides 7600]EWG40870.1 hypothetical protein FVEG_15188 [Fusarium verticillioides 7600]EWG40871.1 hypothetical protein FVEG_15188 [Fusarium verticillioides 7600]
MIILQLMMTRLGCNASPMLSLHVGGCLALLQYGCGCLTGCGCNTRRTSTQRRFSQSVTVSLPLIQPWSRQVPLAEISSALQLNQVGSFPPWIHADILTRGCKLRHFVLASSGTNKNS